MNFISAEKISKSYGEKVLFKDLNTGVLEGERIGLIGINGTGKSSLLKIFAGIDVPDGGTVSVRKDLKIGFLGQNPVFEEEKTVFDNVFYSNNSILTLIKDYEAHLMADPASKGYDDKLHDLMEQMSARNAWDYEQQTNEIISRLGIDAYIDRPVKQLSGGQRKRVAMARVLIDEPELLILDEPTNHLDLETIEWLENLILSRFKTILLVTHDRYFLDKIVNHIFELDRGELYKYKGDYTYFLEKKAQREEIQNAEIDKAKNLMRKEQEWIRRQPKARGTKAKYRVDAFEDLKVKATQQKADEKLELQLKTSRQGGKIMEVKNLCKSFSGLTLIDKFSYVFKKGDKIGIVGKNGAGKSTFLNLLTGALSPDAGTVDPGLTTVFGFYKQEDDSIDESLRIIEVVKEIAEYVELADGQKISASQFLKMFMFPPEVQYTYVGKLSGGEKKRLALLKVLIKNPNFLILDEPTNDLDIGTLDVLEDFLYQFGGTLIIVSHDRYFMDRLVDHLFVFEGKGVISDFPGNYTEYREREIEEEEEKTDSQHVVSTKSHNASIQKATDEQKRKLSYKEKTEYEGLEQKIDAMETEKALLIEKLAQVGDNHELLMETSKKIELLTVEIETKTLRWMELGEFA